MKMMVAIKSFVMGNDKIMRGEPIIVSDMKAKQLFEKKLAREKTDSDEKLFFPDYNVYETMNDAPDNTISESINVIIKSDNVARRAGRQKKNPPRFVAYRLE